MEVWLAMGISDTLGFMASITGNMLGDVSRSGGLFGFVRNPSTGNPKTTINASYVVTQFQTLRQGNNQYGGLVGDNNDGSHYRRFLLGQHNTYST